MSLDFLVTFSSMEKVTNKNTDVNPYFFRYSGSFLRQSSPKTPFLVHNPEPFSNKSRTKLEQNPLKTPLPKPHNKTHCNNVTSSLSRCPPKPHLIRKKPISRPISRPIGTTSSIPKQ